MVHEVPKTGSCPVDVHPYKAPESNFEIPATSGAETGSLKSVAASVLVCFALTATAMHFYWSLSKAASTLTSNDALNHWCKWYFFGGAALCVALNCLAVCLLCFLVLRIVPATAIAVFLIICGVFVSVIGWFAVLIAAV
ncbi:MAG: hypothetical protein AAF745_05070 [Planctomycetota bacterium]